MSSEFAKYQPDRPSGQSLAVEISTLTPAEVEACATLAAAREGEAPGRWRRVFSAALADDEQVVLVARAGDTIAGYGRAAFLRPGEKGARGMPDGWYLTGVVVAPALRRRGIGRRLTEARLRALAGRGAVRYFASVANRATLDLHRELGFREVTRDVGYPGVTFTGGVGVLCVHDGLPTALGRPAGC